MMRLRPRDESPDIRQVIDLVEQQEGFRDAQLRKESSKLDTTLLQHRLSEIIQPRRRRKSAVAWMLRFYEVYKNVAAIMLLAILAAVVFFGTVDAAREPFFTWIREMTSRQSRLGEDITPSLSVVALPEDWRGYFYPTYIPEGYSLNSYNSKNMQRFLDFQNSAGQVILVWQGDKDTVAIAIDNEDAQEFECVVNGYPALLTIKGELRMLTWRTDKFAFRIDGYIADNEIEKIAGNLKQIE